MQCCTFSLNRSHSENPHPRVTGARFRAGADTRLPCSVQTRLRSARALFESRGQGSAKEPRSRIFEGPHLGRLSRLSGSEQLDVVVAVDSRFER